MSWDAIDRGDPASKMSEVRSSDSLTRDVDDVDTTGHADTETRSEGIEAPRLRPAQSERHEIIKAAAPSAGEKLDTALLSEVRDTIRE